MLPPPPPAEAVHDNILDDYTGWYYWLVEDDVGPFHRVSIDYLPATTFAEAGRVVATDPSAGSFLQYDEAINLTVRGYKSWNPYIALSYPSTSPVGV